MFLYRKKTTTHFVCENTRPKNNVMFSTLKSKLQITFQLFWAVHFHTAYALPILIKVRWVLVSAPLSLSLKHVWVGFFFFFFFFAE